MGAVNLVFQGGGVKGAAYAHVLDKIPPDVEIRHVGGSSAGAIMAALVAVDKTPQEIAAILQSQDLAVLLADDEKSRFDRLLELLANLKDVYARFQAGKKWRAGKLLARLLRKDLPGLQADARMISEQRGLYSTQRLRKWLRPHLQNAAGQDLKFSDLKNGRDLRIVAADLSTRSLGVFRRSLHAGKPIIDAVVASASLPIFFQPYVDGETYHVDGGLLSNFPCFLFAHDDAPTVGFQLVARESSHEDSRQKKDAFQQAFDYALSVLNTMLDAQDKHRDRPQNFHAYPIEVGGIPAWRFDLSKEDIRTLMAAGKAVGERVTWADHVAGASPTTYDAKPFGALNLCLREAQKIGPLLDVDGVWPEELEEEVILCVWVLPNYSGRYECISTLKITAGARPLLSLPWSHYPTNNVATEQEEQVSICDLNFEVFEVGPTGEERLTGLPTLSSPEVKEFRVFFPRAVQPGEPSRTFRAGWTRVDDFGPKLKNGKEDAVWIQFSRRAKRHVVKPRIVINVPVSMPQLDTTLLPLGGGSLVYDPERPVLDRNQIAHRQYIIDYNQEVAPAAGDRKLVAKMAFRK